MKTSNKSREAIISEKIEKSLQEWKLPPSSASDVFVSSRSFCCIPNPDCGVQTLEKEIPLAEGYASFPLFSSFRKRANQIFYNYLRVGMIQVGLKPAKLGSNMSAVICVRDKRLVKFYDSILAMVESNLNDGPIYFSYFPNHSVHLSDSSDAFCIDVKIQGNENLTLLYRVHYKVMKEISLFIDLSSRCHADEKGETTLFITDIAQSNRVVSKKISWDEIMIGEEGLVHENNLPSSSSSSRGAVGNSNVEWKETAEAHVLKVDVPGFKKEEVRVEVEGGGILQISGERRDQDDDESDKWHCVERSSGKFLRRVRLPENAKLDEVKAAVENGVLTLTVPKEEVNKKRQVVKVIDISG